MARARRSTTARLVAAGTALIVVGIIVVIAFAAAQTGCQNVAMNATGSVGAPRCTAETVGAAVGWVLVVVGGLSFAAAALSLTPRFSGDRATPPADDGPPA